MKLTIKLTEILALLNSRSPNSGIVFTDVEVVRDRTEDVALTIDYRLPIVEKLQRAVGPWLINGSGKAANIGDKISAIKLLRALVYNHPTAFNYGGNSMHLADAKYAVENWTKFLAYVSRHNALPPRGFAFQTPNPLD